MNDGDEIMSAVPVEGDPQPPEQKRRGRPPGKKRKNEPETLEEAQKRIGEALQQVMYEASLPKAMSDTQLKDRLNAYLARCYQRRVYPTVEEGLLATGYSRQYMMRIAQGKNRGRYFSPEAADIINRFIDICAAIDAKMVMSGHGNTVGYIYRSKQHYGYSDKAEISLVAENEGTDNVSLDEIKKRYATETTFTDAESEKSQNGAESAESP